MLNVFDHIPAGFMTAAAKDLYDLLGGPSLIRLSGKRQPALWVSALLHGNEPAGLQVVQKVLSDYLAGGGQKELPRDMVIFVGNVEAAREGLRHLPGQPDFNRVWPGGGAGGPVADMLVQLVRQMRDEGLFASIDIHNNTGDNPYYGCVNALEPAPLYLASLFSDIVTYFQVPKGVQSMAFSHLCPATTLECGKPNDKEGVKRATAMVDHVLNMKTFPQNPVIPKTLSVVHTIARVRLRPGVSVAFGEGKADVLFTKGLEKWNFTTVPTGTPLARIQAGPAMPLLIEGENGEDITNRYLEFKNSCVCTKVPILPAMLTKDTYVIQNDCLCYLMEKVLMSDAA